MISSPPVPAGRRPPLALVAGGAITLAIVAMGLIALVWTPWPVEAMDIVGKLRRPSPAHPLGTDHFGRDGLSMIMAGAQNALAVTLAAVALGLGAGVPLGLLAAARGGLVDEAVMRLNDLIFAFPALLLAVMIAAVFGPGALNAVIAIGVFNIPVFARVTRGAAAGLWMRDYVLAARMAGKSRALISVQHILPNLTGLLAVQVTIQAAMAVVAEAGLSYVGLGAQPPTPSWGRMLAEAQTLAEAAPWLAITPGLAIVALALGLGLLGEGLRDLTDPRLGREP